MAWLQLDGYGLYFFYDLLQGSTVLSFISNASYFTPPYIIQEISSLRWIALVDINETFTVYKEVNIVFCLEHFNGSN